MRFALAVVIVVLVVAGWFSVCLRLVAWQVARGQGVQSMGLRSARDVRTRLPRQRSRPALPEGHRPPPGLGPLSPSERFLTQEASRGLRELQLFLVDQRA